MADLSITASAVRGTRSNTAAAAVALTAGKVVYVNASSKLALSDANVTEAATVSGIVLNAAEADQPASIHSSGDLTVSSVLTPGTFYYLSATAGGICPVADLATGHRVIQIGYAKSATVLAVNIIDTGIVL
jgi:hypothetical protein